MHKLNISLALRSTLLLYAGMMSTTAAHTPYLMPNAFEPINGGLITLDASFAERFFVPEVVFDGSDFEVRLPDGNTVKPETLVPLKYITLSLLKSPPPAFNEGFLVVKLFD